MVPPPHLWLFVLSTLALLLAPGPTVLYIVTRSIMQGRRAGLSCVFGLGCGTLIHVVVATLGLSALLASNMLLMDLLRFGGAAYVIVLALQQWAGPSAAVPHEVNGRAQGQHFVQSVLVNALNPKIALFFVAFLPNFVSAERGPLPPQFLLLGLLFVALACCTNALYALCSSALGGVLRGNTRFWALETRIAGGVYLGLGLIIALTTHG